MQVGVTHSTDWRVLWEQQLHVYHVQHVQASSIQDYPAQVMSCPWFLQHCGRNPNFLAFVISIDEAQSQEMESRIFTTRICVHMNIHISFFHHITNSGSPCISGPVFVVIIYSDPTYFQTGLQGKITKLSRKTTCLISWLKCHWSFIENCTSCMISLPNISVLLPTGTCRKFPGLWMDIDEPIAWHSSSLDLNPLDFYLWGHLKSLLYSTPVDNFETLQNRNVTDF
jgi:hypothetical protein